MTPEEQKNHQKLLRDYELTIRENAHLAQRLNDEQHTSCRLFFGMLLSIFATATEAILIYILFLK